MSWGELAKARGASRGALTAHAMNLALEAVEVEVEVDGIQTLLLPAERVTAAHEAGHAALNAAKGHPAMHRAHLARTGGSRVRGVVRFRAGSAGPDHPSAATAASGAIASLRHPGGLAGGGSCSCRAL